MNENMLKEYIDKIINEYTSQGIFILTEDIVNDRSFLATNAYKLNECTKKMAKKKKSNLKKSLDLTNFVNKNKKISNQVFKKRKTLFKSNDIIIDDEIDNEIENEEENHIENEEENHIDDQIDDDEEDNHIDDEIDDDDSQIKSKREREAQLEELISNMTPKKRKKVYESH